VQNLGQHTFLSWVRVVVLEKFSLVVKEFAMRHLAKQGESRFCRLSVSAQLLSRVYHLAEVRIGVVFGSQVERGLSGGTRGLRFVTLGFLLFQIDFRVDQI
jgi:hypothetical protein